MADRQFPAPVDFRGKPEQARLEEKRQETLKILMSLLPSTYMSDICGPNYTVLLKQMADELSQLVLGLEDIGNDRDFDLTRSEFLYQIVGYLIFLNGNLPELEMSDVEFKEFLLTIIRLYFQGSTADSILEGVQLFTTNAVAVRENFLDARTPGSGFDISDQFGFRIDITIDGDTFPENPFDLEQNTRLLVNIIRPAHTLYNIRFIFSDVFDSLTEITDESWWKLCWYQYDDIRKFCRGVKQMTGVSGETLSDLFTFKDIGRTFRKIRDGAKLRILGGINEGEYTVTDVLSEFEIKVTPRMVAPAVGQSYELDVDRLGVKEEQTVVGEDVSSQFLP
jgi:hypothetical protein